MDKQRKKTKTMPHYLDQHQPTRRRPYSTTPITSEKQNINTNTNNANRALEIRAALQRQQEMVRRIKEVQALSSSPSIQSAFAPSISSTKPRKQKAEFHFRTRSISTEPPKVELQDLSATTGTAKGVSRFDTKKKSATASATTPVVNNHNYSSSSPTPQPAADSYSTTPISPNISLGLVATNNNNSGANLLLNETTTSTSSSSLQHQQQLLHSSSASATISHLQQSFIQQQQFQAQVLGRSSSPIAARIFSESNNVRKFTNQLNDSKQKMEKQTRVEPTAVVQHDDIRATKMTKKETQRANFLRGVLGEKKLPVHHHQNNTSRTRSSTSPHRRPNSAAPPGSHADNEAEQEEAKKRLLFSAQRVLTPNPDILPNTSHLSPQHHRFVSTPQGAKCFVKPSSHTPTDFTRGTCKVLCQYKSLQNAVKKISGAKNVVFSALEAQVVKKKKTASSVGGEQGHHDDVDDDEQQQEQNSAVVALAEISKRRTGLVRKT